MIQLFSGYFLQLPNTPFTAFTQTQAALLQKGEKHPKEYQFVRLRLVEGVLSPLQAHRNMKSLLLHILVGNYIFRG